MHDFIQYIFHIGLRGLILALPLVLLSIGLLVGLYVVFQRKWKGEKQFPIGKVIAVLLLVGYGAVVVYVTLLRGDPHAGHYANLQLFRAWREAWYQCSLQGWLNVLLNVALFVPLGVLLPLLSPAFEKWYWMLAASFGGSLAIETAQLITGQGFFDVDDLFCNTLGGLLGYCAILFLLHLLKQGQRKSALWYLLLPVSFCAVLAGLYGYYQGKEYGNLPEAPFFRADTGNVTWETDLTFDDAPGTASVYWMEPFTRETCDDFGYAFAQRAGFPVVATDIYYYDNCTIFANHSTGDFLNVNYFDRSYAYDIGHPPVVAAQIEAELEEELRDILADWGVIVPEPAAFVRGDSGYTFLCTMEQEGDRLVDGTLSLTMDDQGRLIRFRNELKDCACYGETAILSPAEAYGRLVRGRFSRGDLFEAIAPEQVEVLTYELIWQVDSKGFYRPVYDFSCSLDGKEAEDFRVPAM